jgi:hypothetical protein
VIRLKIALHAGVFVYDKKLLKQMLRKAGQEVAAGARKRIRAKIGGGRVYGGSGGSAQYRGYKKGKYGASLAGGSPVNVTGTLARSIKVIAFKSGEGVAIRDMMFYGLFLEAGAEGGIGSGGGKSTRSTRKADGGKVNRSGQRNSYTKKGVRVGLVGSRVVKPRPFLSVELDADAASIGDRLMVAVTKGIGWQKKP